MTIYSQVNLGFSPWAILPLPYHSYHIAYAKKGKCPSICFLFKANSMSSNCILKRLTRRLQIARYSPSEDERCQASLPLKQGADWAIQSKLELFPKYHKCLPIRTAAQADETNSGRRGCGTAQSWHFCVNIAGLLSWTFFQILLPITKVLTS